MRPDDLDKKIARFVAVSTELRRWMILFVSVFASCSFLF